MKILILLDVNLFFNKNNKHFLEFLTFFAHTHNSFFFRIFVQFNSGYQNRSFVVCTALFFIIFLVFFHWIRFSFFTSKIYIKSQKLMHFYYIFTELSFLLVSLVFSSIIRWNCCYCLWNWNSINFLLLSLFVLFFWDFLFCCWIFFTNFFLAKKQTSFVYITSDYYR